MSYVLDMFTIGIGPSSSHTVGPMKAAHHFLSNQLHLLNQANKLTVHCYGSLALTGQGHGTDKAIIFGLLGHQPHKICPDSANQKYIQLCETKQLPLMNQYPITFDPDQHIFFDTIKRYDYHSNALKFSLYNASNTLLSEDVYFSIGGGFIEQENNHSNSSESNIAIPYPFINAKELLEQADKHQKTIADLVLDNTLSYYNQSYIDNYLDQIADTMFATITSGMNNTGIINNSLQQVRRAPQLAKKLKSLRDDPHHCLHHLTCYAIAVGEQNAAGDIIVTSPTNGAAGIIPAVMYYYSQFHKDQRWDGDLRCFLLTSGAIGLLYKRNASISGAEMGCQGEVGVACSMAAAGLTAVLGGNNQQIENAAEIAMEHNLGLTCDPIKGLVQIPCIERNAMAAVKAFNAALLALAGDGEHFVSLDHAIETMRQVGIDMQSKYKETALGGLATVTTNIVNC